MLKVVSYWILPIFAACVWLATLLAMLIDWIVIGEPVYPSMETNQTIAYISDVGAQKLKPLFIAGSAVTVVVFDFVFISERWLRHKGRLAHNTSTNQKVWSTLAVVGSIVGAAGLILLSIFDTLRHPKLHDVFLCIFIAGYIVSAIFICVEYQRLGYHFREYRILRISFWIKLAFIFVELGLAIAFAVLGRNHHRNIAAVIEWVIALIYICYVASFAIDFFPALKTKHNRFPTLAEIAAEKGQNGPSLTGGPTYGEHGDDHYMESHSRGSAASTIPMRAEQNVTASRNF